MNRRAVAAAIFFAFFFLGYITMGSIRHDLYSEKRQYYLSECLAQLEKGIEKPEGVHISAQGFGGKEIRKAREGCQGEIPEA